MISMVESIVPSLPEVDGIPFSRSGHANVIHKRILTFELLFVYLDLIHSHFNIDYVDVCPTGLLC